MTRVQPALTGYLVEVTRGSAAMWRSVMKALLVVLGLVGTAASAQAGDPAAGQKIFARCAACHAVGPDAKNKIGPQLNGIVGRKAATAPGFIYSAAMSNSKITWTKAQLDTYLAAPMKVVPGTKMMFMGLPQAKDRADVIAYLAQYGPTGAIKK